MTLDSRWLDKIDVQGPQTTFKDINYAIFVDIAYEPTFATSVDIIERQVIIKVQYDVVMKNPIWILVDCPLVVNSYGSKWFYRNN